MSQAGALSQAPPPLDRTKPWIGGKRIAFAGAVYLAGLLMLEGISSFAWSFFAHDAPAPRAFAEVRHGTYDPDLGWAHIPSTRIEDMYGEGVYLETNSQGLRSSREFSQQVPEGRTRIVCSGDSFTLGYGVSNDETWCELLNGFDERLETVNMGQGGYGLDQAYLWYLRDGEALEHDILLFAFITEDLQRMRHREFVGYGKPQLRLEDGELVVGNQPVPEFGPRLKRSLESLEFLRNLRISSILGAGLGALRSSVGQDEMDEQEMFEIAATIFKDLHRISQEKGRKLVLVHLPTKEDYPSAQSAGMRGWIAEGAARYGIPYVDLIEGIDDVPVPEMVRLFRSAHYSVPGNQYIADRLYAGLRGAKVLPEREQSLALREVAR